MVRSPWNQSGRKGKGLRRKGFAKEPSLEFRLNEKKTLASHCADLANGPVEGDASAFDLERKLNVKKIKIRIFAFFKAFLKTKVSFLVISVILRPTIYIY